MTTPFMQLLNDDVWAILPEALAAILAAARGEVKAAAASRANPAQSGAVAVLPVQGVIIPRGNAFLEEFFGVASTTTIAANFRAALADPAVSAIVLDISSPGGTVHGVEELAAELYAARGQKPVVAVANHLAASAAYWIATAADEVMVAPSGEVGSIGVFAAHADYSRALEQDGVTVSLVSAGKYKTEANPYQPLTDEARAAMQARVDDYYGAFVGAVARGRGVSAADVRDGFGEGRVVGADDAVRLGMADRVGTLGDAVARATKLARTASVGGNTRADLDLRQRRLRLAEHL